MVLKRIVHQKALIRRIFARSCADQGAFVNEAARQFVQTPTVMGAKSVCDLLLGCYFMELPVVLEERDLLVKSLVRFRKEQQ